MRQEISIDEYAQALALRAAPLASALGRRLPELNIPIATPEDRIVAAGVFLLLAAGIARAVGMPEDVLLGVTAEFYDHTMDVTTGYKA